MKRREELKELQRLIKIVLAQDRLGLIRKMDADEAAKYKAEFGDYDFVIGNFAINNLNKLKRE